MPSGMMPTPSRRRIGSPPSSGPKRYSPSGMSRARLQSVTRASRSGPLILYASSSSSRVQVLAVGDDLGGQLVEVERRFQHAAAHRIGLRLPQAGAVGHGAEEVIDVAHAPADGRLHLLEGGIANGRRCSGCRVPGRRGRTPRRPAVPARRSPWRCSRRSRDRPGTRPATAAAPTRRDDSRAPPAAKYGP